MYTIDFIYNRPLLQNFSQMPGVVKAVVRQKVEEWTYKVEDQLLDNLNSRLSEKSGRLIRAVFAEVREQGNAIQGVVGFDDSVPYAKAQMVGAIIPPHIIRPKNGKVLAFLSATGNKVFATRVFHPGATIKGTDALKDAYRETTPKAQADIKKAIINGLRQNMRNS